MNILNKNYLAIYKKMVVTEAAFVKGIENDLAEINAVIADKDLTLLENELALKYSPVYQRLTEEMLIDKLHQLAKKVNNEKKIDLTEAVRLNKFLEMLDGKESIETNLFFSEGYKLCTDVIELTEKNKFEAFAAVTRITEAYENAIEKKDYKILAAVSNL